MFETSQGMDKATAQKYLAQARAALAQENLTAAVGLYHRAAKLGVQFGPDEDSPEKLAAELRQRGLSPSQLDPAPSTADSDLPFEREAARAAASDRVSPYPNATCAEQPAQIVNNPYATRLDRGGPVAPPPPAAGETRTNMRPLPQGREYPPDTGFAPRKPLPHPMFDRTPENTPGPRSGEAMPRAVRRSAADQPADQRPAIVRDL